MGQKTIRTYLGHNGVCSSPAKCPAIGWHGRLRPVTFVGSTLISVTYVTPRFPAVPSDPQQSPASPAVPSRPQPSPAVPSGPKPSEPSPAVPSSPAVTAGRPECVLSRPRAHQLHLSSTDLYGSTLTRSKAPRELFSSRAHSGLRVGKVLLAEADVFAVEGCGNNFIISVALIGKKSVY